MEYLLTYGWAILVIAIVLAALFALGVFSQTPYGVNVCIPSVSYVCTPPALAGNGLLSLNIGQAAFATMSVTGIACTNSSVAPQSFTSVSVTIPQDTNASFQVQCPISNFIIGQVFTGYVWLQYNTPFASNQIANIATIEALVRSQGVSVSTPPNTPPAFYVIANVPTQSGPYYFATYDSADGYIYVPNEDSDSVSVISDTNSISNVHTGSNTQPAASAYDSGNGYVYVMCPLIDEICVLSGTSLVGTPEAPGEASRPQFAIYDSGNGYMYVPGYAIDTAGIYVSVLSDTTFVANVMVQPNPIDANPEPYLSGAYDSGNGYVYVADSNNNEVSVVSGTSLVANVPVGDEPEWVTYDPGNGYVYVQNFNGDTVSVISGTSVIGTVAVGDGPYGAAYDPTNGYVYVPNSSSNNVSVISGTSVVGTANTETGPSMAAYDPASGFIYVPDFGSDSVTVISSKSSIANVTVQSSPSWIAYDSGNGYVYVVNQGSDTVSVVETVT